jgi:uncharacterized RDD family membrane protein YckC
VNAQSAIDLTAVITTPENIQFEYRIAGPFRRLPALLLDFAIRVICFLVAFVLLLIVGLSIPFSGSIATMLFLIFWFAIDWFYGLVFESSWNGQTPGKYLTKIRVISIDGRPINGYQATVRNFLRLADFAPMVSLEMFFEDAPAVYMVPTFLVSLICMSITSRFQRLGDIAAGTMVVVNERAWVPNNVKLEDPRIASLSEHIPANFRMSSTLAKVIALYAERRTRIPTARRAELASHLARPLLKQFQFRDDTSPDLLLCALYYREFVTKDAFVDTRVQSLPSPLKREAPVPSSDDSPVQAPISNSLPPILNPSTTESTATANPIPLDRQVL